MAVPKTFDIGAFTVGEKPEPLFYEFQDDTGAKIDVSGFNADFTFREQFGQPIVKAASIVNGSAYYQWDGTELTAPGHYVGQFWVGNTVQRFASILLLFTVAQSVGPVPVI